MAKKKAANGNSEARLAALRADFEALRAGMKGLYGDVSVVASERAALAMRSAEEIADRAVALAEEAAGQAKATALEYKQEAQEWADENAEELRAHPSMEQEAHARELAAQYLVETAQCMAMDETHAAMLQQIVDSAARMSALRAMLDAAPGAPGQEAAAVQAEPPFGTKRASALAVSSGRRASRELALIVNAADCWSSLYRTTSPTNARSRSMKFSRCGSWLP